MHGCDAKREAFWRSLTKRRSDDCHYVRVMAILEGRPDLFHFSTPFFTEALLKAHQPSMDNIS